MTVTKFLLNNKCIICLKFMYRFKHHGCLSVPDFWSYYFAYQMRSLRTWMDAKFNCAVASIRN